MTEIAAAPSKLSKSLRTIVSIAIVLGVSFGVRYLMSKSPEQKAAELASALKELAAKENPASPQDLADGLKLLSVTAQGNEILYTYSVPPDMETKVRYGEFERTEQQTFSLCAGPAKAVVDAGAAYVFVYLKAGTTEELSRSRVWICV